MNDKQQLVALGEEMAEGLTDEGVVATTTASLLAAAALLNTCRPYVASAAIGGGFGYETALLSEMDKWVGAVSFESDRRVAACLSACEGFDDPVDEVGQIRRYIPLLTDRMLSAERQRDELMAALEALVKIVADTPSPNSDDVFAVIAEARAVINKVRSRR